MKQNPDSADRTVQDATEAARPATAYPAEQARQVLLEVERISTSGLLGSGARLEAILRYIVREELDGRGERLKAYSIGTDVLGRTGDFDPANDSIVRVEMGRLRKALDLVEARGAADSDLVIRLEKGSYRPQFAFRRGRTGADRRIWRRGAMVLGLVVGLAGLGVTGFLFSRTAPAPRSPQVVTAPAPEVLLLPIINSGPAEWQSTARQLRFDLASFLAGQPWLNVHLAESQDAARRMAQAQSQSATYALEIDLVADQGAMKLLVSLMNAPSLRVIWTGSYPITASLDGLSKAASEVARSVASDVAVVNGVIGRAEIDRLAGRDPVTADQQRCLLISGAYWRDYSGTLRQSAEACLETAVRQDSAFADGLAALALLTLDQARSAPGPDREASLAKAGRLAERALAGRRSASVLPETAQLAVQACLAPPAGGGGLATALVGLRPTSDSVLRDAANKVALAANDWEQAGRWLEKAGSAGPQPPSAALSAMVSAILAQEPARALAAVQAIPQFDFAIGHVLRRASAASVGDADARSDSDRALARLGYADRDRQIELVRTQCWQDTIKDRVMAFVRAAPG